MLEYYDNSSGIKIIYSLVSKEIEPVCGIDRAYGIASKMSIDDRLVCSSVVEDAFCSEDGAMQFMEFVAANGVDPCQVQEVFQDYISA